MRTHCRAAGHLRLMALSRPRMPRILTQGEIRPHKIRYYMERRDPEFEPKMAEVLHVYKEVEIINAGLLEGALKEPSVVTNSYDEKPGIQAMATTTPDRPPAPHQFASHLRDYEYQRLGTISLLAALDFTRAGSPKLSVIITPAHTSSCCWANWTRTTRLKPAFDCCSTITPRIFLSKRRRGLVFTRTASNSSSRGNTDPGWIS